MAIEKELRVLEIDKDRVQSQLTKLGAVRVFENMQRRYVYDFNPVDPNRWIRLRDNGKLSTLAVKQILDNTSIQGTREDEVEVSNFNTTKSILSELGYQPAPTKKTIASNIY